MWGLTRVSDAAEQVRAEVSAGVDDLRRTLAILCVVSVTGLLLATLALSATARRERP